MLYEGENTIVDLTLLAPYQAPRIQGIKDSLLEIKATTLQDQRQVIIEMQVLNVQGFQKRVLYNATKAFSIQLDAGKDDRLLHPVVAHSSYRLLAQSPPIPLAHPYYWAPFVLIGNSL